jgi:hypothetical protein
MEEWEYLLPDDLRKTAYRSGGECAWNKADALRVLEILAANGCAVLGVDIWIATAPGPTIPTPFVYDWDPERARESSTEFVTAFAWDPRDHSHAGREPYFNILAERMNGVVQ